jgi:hypothetical protein
MKRKLLQSRKKERRGFDNNNKTKSFSLDVGESKKKKSPKRNMSGLVETCFTTADTFFFFNSPRRRRRRTFFFFITTRFFWCIKNKREEGDFFLEGGTVHNRMGKYINREKQRGVK